jgi:Fe-S cluster assembly protein SufD
VSVALSDTLSELARTLPGPDAWRSARAAAAERAAHAPHPTVEEEIWRYSRVAELDLAAYTPAPDALDSVAVRGPRELLVALDDAGADVVGTVATSADLFSEVNAAVSVPLVVRVAAGKAYAEPLVIRHHVLRDGVLVAPRLYVEAGPDSELTIVERFEGDVASLVTAVVEVKAHPSARVRYLAVNELGRRAHLVAYQAGVAERDATLTLATVAFGGDYARTRTESRLVGTGAHGEQLGVSFGEAGQMHDLRVLQEHVAPRTTSNLLFKGAVQDHARSVYTGLIKIGKDARHSAAFQTNRNLKLSEHAWAESVPNLDIETNDVKCSHASTVGPVDTEQRFYLESRGVPPMVAERLIVLGFFDDVLARLPDPSVQPELHDAVAAKLDRQSA